MNYQIKSSLNLLSIYLIHINHFFTPEIKHVIRGNICPGGGGGRTPSGNCPDNSGSTFLWRLILGSFLTKNTHGGVLLLVKVTHLHGCFFTFFTLYKWQQIAQCITYKNKFLKSLEIFFINFSIATSFFVLHYFL